MERDATGKQQLQTMSDTTDAFASCTPANHHDDDEITIRTLAGMDEAMRNLRIGIVSEDPVHLDDFEKSNDNDVASDDAGCTKE